MDINQFDYEFLAGVWYYGYGAAYNQTYAHCQKMGFDHEGEDPFAYYDED